MTQHDFPDDADLVDSESRLRRLVHSDIVEAVTTRLTPLSGSGARAPRWLPKVLHGPNLTYTVQLNSQFVAVFVEQAHILRKLRREWDKVGSGDFPGAILRHPYQAAINIQGAFTTIGSLTLDGGGVFLEADASLILDDVGIARRNGPFPYNYPVSLCYALGFGKKINPMSAGSSIDALVGYSLAQWRRDATSN
ncbi:hypothetical protein [Burkholderia ambifaria]|uniref:hypothetical protein n=1 Tax=Burkholderia ambifaria TaxID=152480 RepID=UPI00158B1E3B|nr:hypothetical protein [Burkholderia ambifaria]MBR8184906.1 hypothetical protein [Burkholderia ambifaria]